MVLLFLFENRDTFNSPPTLSVSLYLFFLKNDGYERNKSEIYTLLRNWLECLGVLWKRR